MMPKIQRGDSLSKSRYAKLNDDQLLGAEYAVRLLMTSPAINGTALSILREQLTIIIKEIDLRNERSAK